MRWCVSFLPGTNSDKSVPWHIHGIRVNTISAFENEFLWRDERGGLDIGLYDKSHYN
jgi:hypothetical protein